MSNLGGENSDIRKAEQQGDYGITPKESFLQFSKAPVMQNFGDLPFGEIPEPLKYERPMQMTTISNGIRVCTESWNSPTAAVGVFIGAGSRNETLATSGAAHVLRNLLTRGT